MTAINGNQFAISLTLGGNRIPGLWEKATGGLIDSNVSTFYPGGMEDQQVVPGISTTGELTLERTYDLENDHNTKYGAAGNPVSGRGAYIAANGHGVAKVSIVALDANKQAYGTPTVYTGILKSVQLPEPDSSAANTQAKVQLTITCGSPPVAVSDSGVIAASGAQGAGQAASGVLGGIGGL